MSRPSLLVLLPLTACQPAATTPPVKGPPAATMAESRTSATASSDTETEATFESNRESVRALGALTQPTDPEVVRLEQLEHARSLFQAFIERADGRADLAEAFARAQERLADIDAEMEFVRQGLAERKRDELGESPDGEQNVP